MAQHVGRNTDSEQTSGMTYHPGHVSYYRMFKQLDLDHDQRVSRDEWAITLRRHVGLDAQHISDDDLDKMFDVIDDDKNGTLSLKEVRFATSRTTKHVPLSTRMRARAHVSVCQLRSRRIE